MTPLAFIQIGPDVVVSTARLHFLRVAGDSILFFTGGVGEGAVKFADEKAARAEFERIKKVLA